MSSNQNFSVLFGRSTQSLTDAIARNAPVPVFHPDDRIPSRTTICKGYVRFIKKRYHLQKKPYKRIPHFDEE